MNISKSYTATRKCHTSTPSELCQPHSQQDICRCHFLLKLLHPHIRHPPGCRSADWSGAGFQHLPCPPPLSLFRGLLVNLAGSTLSSRPPFPVSLPDTHPPSNCCGASGPQIGLVAPSYTPTPTTPISSLAWATRKVVFLAADWSGSSSLVPKTQYGLALTTASYAELAWSWSKSSLHGPPWCTGNVHIATEYGLIQHMRGGGLVTPTRKIVRLKAWLWHQILRRQRGTTWPPMANFVSMACQPGPWISWVWHGIHCRGQSGPVAAPLSNQPGLAHWPAVAAWWKERIKYTGPYAERTTVVFDRSVVTLG